MAREDRMHPTETFLLEASADKKSIQSNHHRTAMHIFICQAAQLIANSFKRLVAGHASLANFICFDE